MLRRLVVVLLVAAGLVGCGDGADLAGTHRTIAFLRAVANPNPGVERAFLRELADAGWRQGENLTLLAADPDEAHPEDPEEVVRRWVEAGVDLIVALSTGSARAAGAAAPGVPVLFLSTDPVAVGLVEDEREPEGQLTGVTYRVPADRTLDVLRQALGEVGSVGLLWPSPDPAAAPVRRDVLAAGGNLGIEVVDVAFTGDDDVAEAVDLLVGAGVDAVVLANAPALIRAVPAIGRELERAGLPAIANTSVDPALVVLAPDGEQLYRQLGRQAVRLLGGTPVREVPVEDPAGFHLEVHLDVAERLGVSVPDRLVEAADEVRPSRP